MSELLRKRATAQQGQASAVELVDEKEQRGNSHLTCQRSLNSHGATKHSQVVTRQLATFWEIRCKFMIIPGLIKR